MSFDAPRGQAAPNVHGKLEAAAESIISVRSVSKCFRVYDKPEDRLKQSVMSRLRRITGHAARDYFREFWALRDVSLDIRRGETIGIIGRNGSGKSTLLQVICGTLAPTNGHVEVRGRIAALLELGAGFNPEFTGRENVYMSGAVLGLSRDDIDRRFESIVAFADIGEFIEQPVKTYSSGMYVRLAFAVIAHVDADILVIDEALSVGDVFFGQKCMRFLRKFKETGTVVFVSHDANAVINLCERAILLENGVVTQQGDAKEVCEAYHASGYRQVVRKASHRGQVKDAPPSSIHPHAPQSSIQVFRFSEDKVGFGDGRAAIVRSGLTDRDGNELDSIDGGEIVQLRIRVKTHERLDSPIIGFFLKDRLGQALFGDNTYLSYVDAPVEAGPGEILEAMFEFAMPILPLGSYSIDMAVANGTYDEHQQADWIHDALIVESRSSSVSTGLVGIPFHDIRLERLAAE
ncbi:MAG: ABC transporter ATP-binding protein [Xanthomonas sp.]|nr:ABC transporter ATP-binding protein [Xanthomonas sp.]